MPLNIIWLFILGNLVMNLFLSKTADRITKLYGEGMADAEFAKEMVGIHYAVIIPAILLAVFGRVVFPKSYLKYLLVSSLLMALFSLFSVMGL